MESDPGLDPGEGKAIEGREAAQKVHARRLSAITKNKEGLALPALPRCEANQPLFTNFLKEGRINMKDS